MGNSCRRDQQHGPHQTNQHYTSEEEWLDQMERDRKEGRVLLRQMVTKSDDVVDWKAVVDQAESLHKKEQAKIKKRMQQQKKKKKHTSLRAGKHQQDKKTNDKNTAKTTPTTTYSNQVVGSFSVNLLTIRPASEDDDNKAVLLRWRNRRKHHALHSSHHLHHHHHALHSSHHLHHHHGSRTTSAASSREENDEDHDAVRGIVKASGSNDRRFDTSSIVMTN